MASDGRPIASAKVVPAKYGPDKRAAAAPRSAPPIAAARTAITKHKIIGACNSIRATAAAYAPTAINAPWPSDTCPEYPVSKIIDEIAIT
ncbi:unannotated protein [freshwater metagenome]|uniref:Unannotated protein n=1 Tax=freshwater metagenome TaxID=449393 RepID=A0A6J7TE49_9ZZZZ